MKTPGPDHPITLSFRSARVRVLRNDHQIADSADVLVLQEAGYAPVYYFPRTDVAMAFLAKTAHTTHCPFKGDAAYFTLAMDGDIAANAVWSYEHPYPAVELIRERLAFYPQHVVLHEQPLGGEAAVRDIIEHTDAGAGESQLKRWPANVEPPGD